MNIFSGASQPFSIPQSNFLSSLYILDISPLSDLG
uniref:Uncharacterized protein n=1 Tax=Trichinella nativa TaxID=6335 RepID=A0A0V1KH97_9BILA